ncbi:flagellar biosynthesis protein FlhB [Alicyclobacillus cycloheptanicus]|uniref:Flagellar biosynthetic protein FlhB n=1 Tax=Alicyclobacillus cycloheptanicus TaxID=1457 RepID=A0ABT9XJR2_9BACL|nr:flagellar biosynthesis protein FlhB [Alicyclobacillus cycloheptanicus]MDQ0190542.1 flagellar biosynthetic protein FlhB [Alicyclobacillus cycloheptanicus]WDM01385.1 flagellar biosynthesis protein FlhB [Alicyclobacillus cycloheptanicus]
MLPFELQRFAGEKTERATPRRRQELRKEGRVPRSAELTGAVAFLTVLVLLRMEGPTIWGEWLNVIEQGLSNAAGASPLTQADVRALLFTQVWTVVRLLLPLVGGALMVGLLAAFAQTGPIFTPNVLVPDLQRVQPLAGMARLWSARTLAEAVKSLLKLAIVSAVAYASVHQLESESVSLSTVPLEGMPALVGSLVFRLGIQIAVLMLLLAGVDFVYQRYEFERSIRMSREEIKEEAKSQEGDPQIRSKIRQRGRALAMRRMMQQVPTADVVVTNPTHFAVALKYVAKEMAAPIVLAKGQDELALRIRQAAEEANVPTVENRPLARALYETVDLGGAVPPSLFQAVAEVLAYVYRLKGIRTERG